MIYMYDYIYDIYDIYIYAQPPRPPHMFVHWPFLVFMRSSLQEPIV